MSEKAKDGLSLPCGKAEGPVVKGASPTPGAVAQPPPPPQSRAFAEGHGVGGSSLPPSWLLVVGRNPRSLVDVSLPSAFTRPSPKDSTRPAPALIPDDRISPASHFQKCLSNKLTFTGTYRARAAEYLSGGHSVTHNINCTDLKTCTDDFFSVQLFS